MRDQLREGRSDTPPGPDDAAAILAFLAEHAPPVCDPFCGGGSIPLEAQRLGLRAYGSDLNPVAVLVSKATCEIPPKFAGRPPVNPERSALGTWKGAEGLAEDIRYYGQWMRDEAEARIGHLYPKVTVTKAMGAQREDLKPHVGKELTVIAWLWARTVASPDPMMRGAHVPLVSSFMLSTKTGKQAWAEVRRDATSKDGWRFVVMTGELSTGEEEKKKIGTRVGRAQDFLCCLTKTPIQRTLIQAEGKADRLGKRLMAIVVADSRGRLYITPIERDEQVANAADYGELVSNARASFLSGTTPTRAMITGGVCSAYGLKTWGHLFTARQLVALTTLSALVAKAREKAFEDAKKAGVGAGGAPLANGGTSAEAYADAVATYLGLSVSRQANRSSNLTFWDPGGANVQQVFARQALPMVWDFCEANPFSNSSGNFVGQAGYLANAIANMPAGGVGAAVIQQDAAGDTSLVAQAMVATDPPYFDNIGYAELSDFFYVWQRRALLEIWPDLFRRILSPKNNELVATPYRHGGKSQAERFFLEGMARALANMHQSSSEDFPVTIYYAFKQSEVAKEGLTSPGWATFLQGVVNTGYTIDGTWPVRTELSGNLKKRFNTLASSIVLVCRKRATNAPALTRRDFIARLRTTLPKALTNIRAGGVGPVDVAQAAIGPGMGVFTAYSKVLEPDDTPMTVRTAIALINQVRDEISASSIVLVCRNGERRSLRPHSLAEIFDRDTP